MIGPPRLTAMRYVQPLREGGSLPAIVDTEAGMFVTKFRGAGQGRKALAAELIVGMLAREAGLPVPELALIDLLPTFGRSEPDPEIQDLLRASEGLNVGLRYLDGAFNLDVLAAGDLISPELAAGVVWLDAFTTNPDRTPRNPNLLIWERAPWLIDHGAALYAHHDWARVDAERTRTPFPQIRDHVLLARAGDIEAADERLAPAFTRESLTRMMDTVPEDLLRDFGSNPDAADAAFERRRYVDYLSARLEAPRAFVGQAAEAREQRRSEPLVRRTGRR